MSRFGNSDVPSNDFKGSLLTVITLCLLSTGRGSYCVNGFWNPSGVLFVSFVALRKRPRKR